MGVLSHLQPQEVFRYFEEICSIPHGSGDTKKISDYLVKFASDHSLSCTRDEHNNVVIRKSATPGYEEADTVMLQGHMDMVCEKDPGYAIDFRKDGLTLRESGGIITAEGTTLGGDDGIAVAYVMAILASDEIEHPPLEAVFTVDEEIGMLGAAAMDMSSLKARYMLNIDSEDEGYLLVSCAGGVTAVCHLPVIREAYSGTDAQLKVCGCLGGHSGIEIDKGRANANRILGRALYRISRDFEYRVMSAGGGKKDNAIPAESAAQIVLSPQTDTGALSALIEEINRELKNEYAATDSGTHLVLTVSPQGAGAGMMPMSEQTTAHLVSALVNLPNGVLRMSFELPGLVQTSLNMGILETAAEEVRMQFSVRSSVESEKQDLLMTMESLLKTLGGSLTCFGDYPAWAYKEDSRLRELMVEVFEEQYGKKPVVHAIHAGVECGLFAGKMPGLDCISFGPDMQDIHTPRESLDAGSVNRTWKYLLEVLRRLK